jgi:hypothetical protein
MTINLYPHNHNLSALSLNPLPASKFHPVLDYFTLRATNEIRRGLVNLNSRNGHVHAAVLNQMPLREWVGSSTPKLDNTHARGFGDWISTAGISFSNLSGLATIWMGVDDLGQRNGLLITDSTRSPPSCMLSTQMVSSVGSGSFGEFEREALIRNAAALYTTRQQIYTIIVRADAMSLAYGGGSALDGNILNSGSVLGSARGVFQVWRDPVKDPDTGKHRYFVRLCKILN